MLRHRKRTIQAVKKLDAFPKVPEEIVKTSTTSGTSKYFDIILSQACKRGLKFSVLSMHENFSCSVISYLTKF